LTNQKIEFYKLTNEKMLRSIRSAKWTAALIYNVKKKERFRRFIFDGGNLSRSEMSRAATSKEWKTPRARESRGNGSLASRVAKKKK